MHVEHVLALPCCKKGQEPLHHSLSYETGLLLQAPHRPSPKPVVLGGTTGLRYP